MVLRGCLWLRYVYALPSSNITVVSMGQSKGTSLDCEGSYNDGYTLSLIWRAMEEALGLGPKGVVKPRPTRTTPESELPRAGKVGGAGRAAGDRTRASIKLAAEEHEKNKVATEAAYGACCTCVCPPAQGFGQGFNVPADIANKHPFIKEGGACPAAVSRLFPAATGLCPYIGYVQQCPHTSIGQKTCDQGGPAAGNTICAMVPGSTELATSGCRMTLSNTWEECVWTKGACPYTPYYPVTNITGTN